MAKGRRRAARSAQWLIRDVHKWNTEWQSLIGPAGDRPMMRERFDHEMYDEAFCRFMNQVDPRTFAGCGCEWIAPYGFVRNASCELHD